MIARLRQPSCSPSWPECSASTAVGCTTTIKLWGIIKARPRCLTSCADARTRTTFNPQAAERSNQILEASYSPRFLSAIMHRVPEAALRPEFTGSGSRSTSFLSVESQSILWPKGSCARLGLIRLRQGVHDQDSCPQTSSELCRNKAPPRADASREKSFKSGKRSCQGASSSRNGLWGSSYGRRNKCASS
jgi:hypothetical protein